MTEIQQNKKKGKKMQLLFFQEMKIHSTWYNSLLCILVRNPASLLVLLSVWNTVVSRHRDRNQLRALDYSICIRVKLEHMRHAMNKLIFIWIT